MIDYDEQRIGELLRLLPAVPEGWVRAAQELPEARAELAAIVARAEEDAIAALGFPSAGVVLDLGCGPGFVAARLRARAPGLRIVGADRDRGLLMRARAHAQGGAGALPVVRCDARRTPFASGAFDGAFARLLLRNVAEPERVVAEMARVVKPGGVVVVIDSDDGALVGSPLPDGFARMLAARQETYRRRGADPFTARRVPGMMRRAGLVDVSFRSLVLDTVSLGADVFAAIVLAPFADAIDADLVDPAEAGRVRAGFAAWASRPETFAMTTALVFGARVA